MDWEREERILLGRATIFGWAPVGNELRKSGAQTVLASILVRHNYKSPLIGCTLCKDDFQLDRIFLSSPPQFGSVQGKGPMAKMAKTVMILSSTRGTEDGDDGDDDSAIHDCYVSLPFLFANKDQPFLYSKVTAMVYVEFFMASRKASPDLGQVGSWPSLGWADSPRESAKDRFADDLTQAVTLLAF